MSVLHLVTRFLGSLRPGPPAVADLTWLETFTTGPERELFERMSNPDQRHALEVARLVDDELGGAEREVLVAATFHDVGKVVCGYRTPARVVATLVWAVVPDARADAWRHGDGPLRRLGEYRRHPELGAELLAEVDAPTIAVTWAADHHRPRGSWRVDPALGDVLKACDGD